MKHVLITGSLGYIGSVLTSYLEENGFKCGGYDTGFFRDSLLYAPSVTETILRDVRDIQELDLNDVDALVHLAGISNDPFGKIDAGRIYDPTRAYSLDIAKICKKRGIKFIFASSCSVYGIGQEELLTEESPTFPQTPYSLNKLQVEEDLRNLSGKDFSPIALRFATIFGPSPRLRFDVVVNMLTGMAVTSGAVILNSNGTPWRPNVHILDACEAIRRVIELDYNEGKLLVLNVGDESNNLQIIQIAKIIQQAISGCELKFLTENQELDGEGLISDRKIKKGVDTRTYKVSFGKIKKTLPGFECKWSVKRGVEGMIELFRKLNLTEKEFKRRNFYRLQELEYLYESGYLSDELHWLKDRPPLPENIPSAA